MAANTRDRTCARHAMPGGSRPRAADPRVDGWGQARGTTIQVVVAMEEALALHRMREVLYPPFSGGWIYLHTGGIRPIPSAQTVARPNWRGMAVHSTRAGPGLSDVKRPHSWSAKSASRVRCGGWRSAVRARCSSWRMRSRDRPRRSPISCKLCGCSPSRP